MKLKTAFTMAEALLALTIIGVIAAITIPTVKDFSDAGKMSAAAKKAYSTAQQMTTAVEVKYGDSKFWPWSNAALINSRYKEVTDATVPASSYSLLDFSGVALTTVNNNWFQTNDSMVWYANTSRLIYVDTNGQARPNRLGYDVVGFIVNDDEVVPMNDDCVKYILAKGKMPWVTDSNMVACPSLDD